VKRPLILRPAADADVQQIYGDLEQLHAGLGLRFIGQLSGVFERIETMPAMFGVVWRHVRAVRLSGFQYVVYYVAFDDRVEVFGRVAWSARPLDMAIACLAVVPNPNTVHALHATRLKVSPSLAVTSDF
jgi:hypothetical protein